jgi:hypothetical protein
MNIENTFIFFGLKFLIFFLFFFFLGRAVLMLFLKGKNPDNLTISGFNIYLFYPLIGVIFYGNYLVIFNFFLPISSKFVYLYLFFLVPNLILKPNIEFLKKAFKNLVFYPILLITSYDLAYHYDSGLYHLNFQSLLRESNIILGISNIYGPYGVGSIYDYISASIWFDSTMVLLQFVNLIFFILFYEFLLGMIFMKNNRFLNNAGLSVLIFSLLDNLGFNGGRNGFIYFQSLGKQDVQLAIVYFVTLVIIFLNLGKKKTDRLDIFLISLFSLFIVQLKISGVTIVLFYLLLLYHMFKNDNLNRKTFSEIKLIIFLGILWLFKSIFQTGCVIYPLQATCMSTLSWYSADYTKVTLESSKAFSIAYEFDSSLLLWFQEFLNYDINKVILVNYLFSFLIIFNIFFRKSAESRKIDLIPFLCTLLLTQLFYLYYGPHLRYLIAIQIIIIFLLGYMRDFRINLPSKVIYLLVIFSLLALVRLNSYKTFDLYYHPRHDIPIPEVIHYDNRFLPKDGDQCWAVFECSPNRMLYEVQQQKYFKVVSFKDG